MSGGHFDYQQHHIRDIAESIKEYVYGHDLDDEDVEYICNDRWIEEDEKKYIMENKHTRPNRYEFSEETIKEFKEGIKILRMAEVYAERIDYLLSSDDGEDDFKRRLEKDLKKIESENE